MNLQIITQLTFDNVIEGILKDKNNMIWLATEKRIGKAKLASLNSDYTIKETIEISDTTVYLKIACFL